MQQRDQHFEQRCAADHLQPRTVHARWPPADPRETRAFEADVALIAHVGYDIEAIGPFVAALEAAVSRQCVAVLMERVPAAAADPFWPLVHDQKRVALPALPDALKAEFRTWGPGKYDPRHHAFDGTKDLGMMPITIDLKPGETKLINVVRKGYVTRPLKLDGSKTRVVVGLVSETQAAKHKGLNQAEAEAEADRAAEHAAADDATEEVTPAPEEAEAAAPAAKAGGKPGAKAAATKPDAPEPAPKPAARPRGKTPLAPNPFGD